MATITVTDANFTTEVLEASLPVVVDFWAPWCGPCRMIGPILEEISIEMKDKVIIAKVNVDENPQVAGNLGIMSIPTLFIFKDGHMVSKKTGVVPKADLLRWVEGATA